MRALPVRLPSLLMTAALLLSCSHAQNDRQLSQSPMRPADAAAGGEPDAAQEPGEAQEGDAGDEAGAAADAGEDATAEPPGEASPPAPPIPPFASDPDQKAAAPQEWADIEGFAETEQSLAGGKIVWKKTKVALKALKRIGETAKRMVFFFELNLGGRTMKAQGKVPQASYNEWRGEVHGYLLAKRLGIRVPPAVMRLFKKSDLEHLFPQITPEDLEQVKWSGAGKNVTAGSMRLWVDSLAPRVIGATTGDEEYLAAIARALHPGNRAELLGDARYGMYLDMGRGFVLDYIANNNDRARNLGTLLLPDGTLKLILFDFGLGFGAAGTDKPPRKSLGYFKEMRMLPGDVVGNLRTLTKEELEAMCSPPQDKRFSLPKKIVAQVWDRCLGVVEKADALEKEWGPGALY